MFGLMIFFFKQKTAYEMRISDWSSDVCSIDDAATAECACGLGAAVSGWACADAALASPRANAQTRNVARVFIGNGSFGSVVVVVVMLVFGLSRSRWRHRMRFEARMSVV